MSDPMTQRPADPPPPPPEAEPRKSASPLIWILLLIALIAFGWYFYNRSREPVISPDLLPPPATSDAMTPGADGSTEPAASNKPKPARPTVAKVEKPKNRDVALLTDPKPAYPPEAFRAGEEGTVMVMANVDAQGNVSGAEIADRSGSRTLDRAALDEVRRWKFTPAMKDGKTVASTIKVPVDYKLADGKQ